VSGIHSIYRVVNIPKLPKNLLNEAAMREAERVMPVPLEELYTSWQAINISDIETVFCLVGIPRSTVDAIIATLKQAGLEPDAMDIRPLALARVADERNAIVINAQQTGFDIVVMIGGIPELLRSLPFPADTTSPGDKVAEVKEELERTIAFYNSSHQGSEITASMAAFVSGELGDMLAQTLEHRVKPLPHLLSYTDSLNTSEYAANIGLALRQGGAGFSPAQVSLNVTPEVYLPKPFPLMQLVSWAFILLAAAVLILFGISTLQNYQETKRLQNQLNNIQTQITNRQGTQAEIKQLQTQIDEATKSGDTFKKPVDTAMAQRERINTEYSRITSLMPGILDINSIEYGKQIWTVKGIAPDQTIIVDYVRELRNSGQFQSVLISNMNEIAYNEWQFTLTLSAFKLIIKEGS
ncbi:MAG: hypothetical protein JSV54_02835, partial [Chloroflexota bacterium]